MPTTRRYTFRLASSLALVAVTLMIGAGPSVAQPEGAEGVTFTRDIAPILQRSCQHCHRPDSVAPMSLLTYEEARPWARAMKSRTALRNERGAMPPWFVEKNIGIQDYKDDPSLSEAEIATIARWADTGAPRGDMADLPPPKYVAGGEDGWRIGTPDLVLRSREVTVNASGADRWEPIGVVPTGLTEDRYVEAVEIREVNDIPKGGGSNTVGGRFVLHHLNYSSHVVESEQPDAFTGETTTVWPVHEVGRNADIFPPDAGRILAAGSVLNLETAHLHSNGRETKAYLEFAFKLHPVGYKPSVTWVRRLTANGVDISIKPTTADQQLHAYTVLEQHTKILTFEPHMHAPGVRMCLEAIWGHSVQTLTCAGYDHNWVRSYVYADDAAPLLPEGAILHLIGFMDTTPGNRNVADPRNWGGGGRRSVANMFIDLGEAIALTDEEFEGEMGERRERLGLTKNDVVIGCPLCQVRFPSQESAP
ncbi:MAG: cytochrome c [Vicinamibacterales bacterium]|nr:cytochrome c [Vicinamibacterales bacterium]